MQPKTKIPIPEPKGTEFENFDRLAGILMQVPVKKRKPASKRPATKKKK